MKKLSEINTMSLTRGHSLIFFFIMKRSKLRNDYLKHRSEENKLAYKKQRNFCVTSMSITFPSLSISPSLSKAFEKCLYDQIYAYTNSILSEAQCDFRKGYIVLSIQLLQ